MMDYSERSEYVGSNIEPDVKYTLQEYIKREREGGNSISMSRWIAEAISQRIQRDGITILRVNEKYMGEPLPF